MRPGSSAAERPDAPLKHVIEEYRHRLQTVTCVCGWQGSTVSVYGERSAWASHVRDSKLASPDGGPR